MTLVPLPPPRLQAFAAHPFGVTVPSGAAELWRAIAGWQYAGLVRIEIVSSIAYGNAGHVTLTKAGRAAAGAQS